MSLRPTTRAIPGRWPRPSLFSAAPTRFLNTVPRCPSPTCECADIPETPQGLLIDYKTNLNGLMASYAEQVLICTGRNDWPSRIEEDNSDDNLAADLKELIGRGGIYSDLKEKWLTALVKGYLLPEKLHPMNDGLPQIHKDRLLRKDAYRHLLHGVRDVDDVLVLICGHGGRDIRCGVMGPVLHAEFERQLPQAGLEVLHGPLIDESVSSPALSGTEGEKPPTARVGQISHIGGHKFAGNIIIYLPPTFKNDAGNLHPLAGHGVCSKLAPESSFDESITGEHSRIELISMHSNAMRWLGRIRGPTRDVQASICHYRIYDNNSALLRRLRTNSSLSRTFYSSRILTKATPPPKSESASSVPPQSSTQTQTQNLRSQGPQWAILALIFAASAGTAYLYRRQSASSDDDVINTSTFAAFTITGREQVSPTAFIITLRPSAWVDSEGLDSERIKGEPVGFLSNRIQEAWRHGLWSVEIKQPQLQIARHYTPLPPFPMLAGSPSAGKRNSSEDGSTNELQAIRKMDVGLVHEEQDEQTDLRILIRRMDGGEMSNYLSRQRVGDTIWLRGPHLGSDIPRRLGEGSGHASGTEFVHGGSQRGVVFLAGGTGIAPALQIAHKLLDSHNSGSPMESRPHVSILWANRWGIDALGREQASSGQEKPNSWFRFWGGGGSNPSTNLKERGKQTDKEPSSSLALQIQDLKRRHPSHFQISYFVDDENSFIEAHDIEAALSSTFGAKGTSSPSFKIDRRCTWHSAKAVELLPDDNDATRSSSSDPAFACTCTPDAEVETPTVRPGVNLVCVSGPDG
ncbi:hypothetical protein FHL15_010881, partial [Xylaria flabelliformis]